MDQQAFTIGRQFLDAAASAFSRMGVGGQAPVTNSAGEPRC